MMDMVLSYGVELYSGQGQVLGQTGGESHWEGGHIRIHTNSYAAPKNRRIGKPK